MKANISTAETSSANFEWLDGEIPVPYPQALEWMESRVQQIRAGDAPECVWLLEHPPLYTAGTSARDSDLLLPERFPIFRTGRGGQYTYHGPGQRIGYVMLDLDNRGRDIRAFVNSLENWIIDVLGAFGVQGERRPGRVGVWVVRTDLPEPREDKIAAIGVRVRRWVTYHGISLNVSPDLSHYDGIVPCGVQNHGITSLADLGISATMKEVDATLARTFARHFPL